MPWSDGDDAYRIEDVGRMSGSDRALASKGEAPARLTALHPPESHTSASGLDNYAIGRRVDARRIIPATDQHISVLGPAEGVHATETVPQKRT